MLAKDDNFTIYFASTCMCIDLVVLLATLISDQRITMYNQDIE